MNRYIKYIIASVIASFLTNKIIEKFDENSRSKKP